jgi:D-threo-aldose 1-dehydrogenase
VRFDYTREGVLRSLEASFQRLGLDRVDIVYVHDMEPRTHGSEAAYEARLRELIDGGWRALSDLRATGAVTAIGLGVNEVAPCERLLALADPDLFLLAGRYTLLEQTPLTSLFPACARRGVGIVAGGPYNSGVLARPDGSFDYAAPPDSVLARVAALRRVCQASGTPLATAALQFVAAHPQIVSVIPGGQGPAEVRDNAARFGEPIDQGLWDALKSEGLIERAAHTPARTVEAAC